MFSGFQSNAFQTGFQIKRAASSQSGVSRLSRSVKRSYAKRIWYLDLPIPEKVQEVIEFVAEEAINNPEIAQKEAKKEFLEAELLSKGLEYQEKYIEYLQIAISAIRQQMLEYATEVLIKRARNRKRAIFLLLH